MERDSYLLLPAATRFFCHCWTLDYTGWPIWSRTTFCRLWKTELCFSIWSLHCGETFNLMATNSILRPDVPPCTVLPTFCPLLAPVVNEWEEENRKSKRALKRRKPITRLCLFPSRFLPCLRKVFKESSLVSPSGALQRGQVWSSLGIRWQQ